MPESHSAQEKHASISLKSKLALCLATVLLITISWTDMADRHAKQYVDETIGQAGAVFLLARGLNAFLTTAKSVETGPGIMSFRPLEVLDPVHDLVEYFSALMKVSIVSLLIQKFLIEIVSTSIFKYLLTGLGALFLFLLFVGQARVSSWCWKILLLIAMLRFLFVGVALLNAMVDEAFSRSEIEAKKTDVEVLSRELERASRTNLPSPEEETELKEEHGQLRDRLAEMPDQISGTAAEIETHAENLQSIEAQIEEFPRRWIGRSKVPQPLLDARTKVGSDLKQEQEFARSLESEQRIIKERLSEIDDILEGGYPRGWIQEWLSRVRQVIDIVRVAKLKERADQLVDSVLALMALFLLQTIIFPIVFLYLLVKGFKILWSQEPLI